MWIDENFEFEPIDKISIFKPNCFESQFVKLKISKNRFIIVGNIYRPPQNNVSVFNDQLENILTTINNDPILNKADDIQIMSDSNIDLLQYNKHVQTNNYFDTLISNGLLPLITVPTRITQTSATIIDHISTSHKSDRYVAGILLSSLSDHLPIFYIRENNTSRLQPLQNTTTRKINSTTITAFHDLIKSNTFETVRGRGQT